MSKQDSPLLFVGIDWSTTELEVCVEDPSGEVIGTRSVRHNGEGLAELVAWLLVRCSDPARVWVAIELSRGPSVETLLERGFRVFAINPKQLDRFRDRFSPAGSKDDRLDALVLTDSLRTDPHAFRALTVDSPKVLELREWSRMHDELQTERNRLTNRLRAQLQRYYPQALDVPGDIGADWFLSLLELVPDPDAARRRRPASVARILAKHRLRRITAPEVLQILRQTPVCTAPGTVQAAQAHIRLLTDRLRVVNCQIKECQRQMDDVTERLCADRAEEGKQRDDEILRSFPGVARIVLGTLLSEAAQPLAKRDLKALRSLTGSAPVTRRSGKSCVVLMRRACSGRLRRAVYHWAGVAAQCDPIWKSRYAAYRQRGHSHGRACRGIADRLLKVAVAALKSGTLYDPGKLSGPVETV